MKKLINKLFGTRYHIIILFDGVQDFVSSTIFHTREEAKEFAIECTNKKAIRSYRLSTFRTKIPLIFFNR